MSERDRERRGAERKVGWARLLARAKQVHGLADDTTLISAGCGDFLVSELGDKCLDYASHVARVAAPLARRAQVCAPSVAVAALWSRHAQGD